MKGYRFTHIPLIAILGILPIISACTIARMDMRGGLKVQSTGGGTTPAPTPGPGPGPVVPTKANETFTASSAQRKVDILFIDDNSSSMESMQNSLGSRFSSFANAVQGIDWQIGVTTTDCSAGPYGICGSLLTMAGTASKILTPSTPNFASVFANTIVRPETVGCLVRADCPSGDSTPLRAAAMAMQKTNSVNAGFFRDGATLAVVMLTNADENNDVPTASSVTPANVIAQFQGVFGTQKNLRTYTIGVLTGDAACLGQQQASGLAAYATYPIALANQTGGISRSICSANYGPLLQQIGDDLDLEIAPNIIQLAHVPISGSVKVTLAPATGTAWTLNSDKIVFAAPLPSGTVINVEYEY